MQLHLWARLHFVFSFLCLRISRPCLGLFELGPSAVASSWGHVRVCHSLGAGCLRRADLRCHFVAINGARQQPRLLHGRLNGVCSNCFPMRRTTQVGWVYGGLKPGVCILALDGVWVQVSASRCTRQCLMTGPLAEVWVHLLSRGHIAYGESEGGRTGCS